VQDVITVGAGAINFKLDTRSCGLDQPDPSARTFISEAIGGYGLDQPDLGGTNFLSQGGTAIVKR
jgi:hypothetical protein